MCARSSRQAPRICRDVGERARHRVYHRRERHRLQGRRLVAGRQGRHIARRLRWGKIGAVGDLIIKRPEEYCRRGLHGRRQDRHRVRARLRPGTDDRQRRVLRDGHNDVLRGPVLLEHQELGRLTRGLPLKTGAWHRSLWSSFRLLLHPFMRRGWSGVAGGQPEERPLLPEELVQGPFERLADSAAEVDAGVVVPAHYGIDGLPGHAHQVRKLLLRAVLYGPCRLHHQALHSPQPPLPSGGRQGRSLPESGRQGPSKD